MAALVSDSFTNQAMGLIRAGRSRNRASLGRTFSSGCLGIIATSLLRTADNNSQPAKPAWHGPVSQRASTWRSMIRWLKNYHMSKVSVKPSKRIGQVHVVC